MQFNRLYGSILSILLLLGGMPSLAQASGAEMILIKPAKLHVEASGPSAVKEVVWQGEKCQRLGQQEKWIQVKVISSGLTGWIHQSYLKDIAASATSPGAEKSVQTAAQSAAKTATAPERGHLIIPGAESGYAIRLLRSGNLHAAASSESYILESLNQGQTGIMLTREGGWARIQLHSNGHAGWVETAILTVTD